MHEKNQEDICYIPVNAAGLDRVLYWFWVDIILWRGLSVGDATSESSSIIILLLGWFLGSSFNLCSNEYFKRSNFWLDSLNLAWALHREKTTLHLNNYILWIFIKLQLLFKITSESAFLSVTFPEPSNFITFFAPSATANSILKWCLYSSIRSSRGLMTGLARGGEKKKFEPFIWLFNTQWLKLKKKKVTLTLKGKLVLKNQ